MSAQTDHFGEAVVSKLERLIGRRAKPDKLKRWALIANRYDRLVDAAERNEAEGYKKLAALCRAEVERLDLAILGGKSERQIMQLFFHEQAAKDALIAYRRDRDDSSKRREAEVQLHLVSGRWLDPDEEYRIDGELNPEGSGKISRVAGRIVDRVKLC